MDKHRLQITIPESLYKGLKELADKQGVSISALCNIVLSEYFRKNENKQ